MPSPDRLRPNAEAHQGGCYGPCCGLAGVVGECLTCGREACGTCRQGAPTLTAAACARCGDRSCADCSRSLNVVRCEVCDRDVCRACLTNRVCGTCRDLMAASEDEIAALPPQLMVAGLAIYIGHDEGGSVVLLRGPHRLELAVVDAAGLATWTTAAEDELAALRLGASILSGRGDVEITGVTVDPVAVPRDAYILDRHSDTRFGWAILVDGRWRGGTDMPPAAASAVAPDPTLIADLTAAVTAATVEHAEPGLATPAQAAAVRRASGAIKAPMTDAEIVAFRQPTEDIVMLDERGLVARRVFGRALSETVGEWGHPDGDFEWAGVGWHPAPEIVAAARLDGWAAAVVAVGRFAVVGVRCGDESPVWHSLGTAGADDLYRASVGATFLGASALASVAAATAPGDVRGPVIADAALVARRTSYFFSEPPADATPDPCPRKTPGHG